MKNKDSKISELKQGQRIAFIATIATLLLAVMKAIIGYVFDSKILIADAFHSGADFLAISASGFGLWLASKRKTRRFPYGLYKAETLVSFIIGILIIWSGVEMLQDGYQKFYMIASVKKFPVFPVCASMISIIVAYIIARKEKIVGESINSQSLLANASESLLDILISAVVLMGLLLAYMKIPYIEGSVIIFISLLIFKLGLKNIWISLLVLMDANLDPQLQYEIENKINEIYGVKGISEVNIRQSGPFKMIECTIETSPSLPLYRAHELANKVENFITKHYKHIDSVFIHLEPAKDKIISAIFPVNDVNELNSIMYGHFGRAPYFLIARLSDHTIEIEDFYCNEFLQEKKHIGLKVIKAIIKYKIDILFTSKIGEISFYMLKDNFVDIYKIREGISVKEVIEKYNNNELIKITTPTHPIDESQSVKT